MRPTPLADANYITVLIMAAKGSIERQICCCDLMEETCFKCETEAAIKKAKQAEELSSWIVTGSLQ